jgi:PPOX class probable F420-dependent enzyme
VDVVTMRRRVVEARVGRLATVTPDGGPHVVPCCYAIEGDTVYSAVDGKPKSTPQLQRLDNIRRHPATSLLVDHYDDDWATLWWIRLDGAARVLEPGEASEHAHAVDLLVEKYQQYREQRPTDAVVALDVRVWRAWAA